MDFNPLIRAWLEGNRPDDATPEQWRAISLIVAGMADDEHIESAGREFCEGVKAAYSLYRRGHVIEGAQERAPTEEGVIRWVLSREDADRSGDVIRQRGWNLKQFKANPVVLFGHKYRDEPIGRADNLAIENVKGVPALVGDIRFAVQESEEAARLYRLAAGQFMRAGSVGFRPIKTLIPDSDEERQKLGVGRFGVVFEKAELLEFSIVTVPAHPGALQRALKDGTLNDEDAEWANALGDPTEKEWEKLMRKRARAFVDFGKAQPSDAEPEEDRALALLADFRTTLEKLGDGQAQQAAALDSLAQSITDLSTSIGVERKAVAEPPTKAANDDPEADLISSLQIIKEQLTKHLTKET